MRGITANLNESDVEYRICSVQSICIRTPLHCRYYSIAVFGYNINACIVVKFGLEGFDEIPTSVRSVNDLVCKVESSDDNDGDYADCVFI